MSKPRFEDRYEQVEVASQEEWRRWLEANHGRREGILLVTYKKVRPDKYMPWEAIVEEAIAYGWIDSRAAKVDSERTMILVSPRKKGSGWSRINKAVVERLEAEGRMHEAGASVVAAARADGSWNALDDVENLLQPPDLIEAFKVNSTSRDNFEAFPRSAKRAILEWLSAAKKPETRADRIKKIVTDAADNRRSIG